LYQKSLSRMVTGFR